MKRWGSWIAVLMLLIMLVSGCSSASHDKAAGADVMDEKSSATVAEAVPQAKQETASMDSSSQVEQPAGAEQKLPESPLQTASGTNGLNAQDLASGLNQKLIYKANIVMEIPDYDQAQTEIRNRVTLSGGYIINFSETASTGEKGGTFAIKVPAKGFSSFLAGLEKIKHERLERSIEGQDVTEEYVDLESRLKAKQLMEQQYIEFMKKATKTDDLVAFANELERIQSEIEQIKGRMRYIDQNVSYSTVEIRLYETAKEPAQIKNVQPPLGKRANQAFQGSIDVITQVFQWIVVILSGSTPVLIVAAIILLVIWAVRKSGERKRREAAIRRKQLNAGAYPKEESIEEPIKEETDRQDS
ncbi:DUF4349 domain-containing protein [Paenibacillus donghaensis]|uniref:DUF4349 domain-containing protein n=1 Tax=Paenibacillus donghaensis TaxID=414771 RepID=UPI001883A359|nr:DUF4349 domain-containing protein [Paenibacillus donghaensis]MBE9912512.1 DUF4349 domain-containing protein [Paenibacillus donghaensis]